MPGNEVDPVERDFLIRTIIGEAANQPDMGKAAVAHVVLNRVNDGGFQGDNIQQVVTAPKQFEPWGTRAAQLKAISPQSPQYQDAASIADGVKVAGSRRWGT
jgi:conjugal transfer mating pair stabilization protein TraG